MAASSITKNFVVSGQESLTRQQSDKPIKYRELRDPEEIRGLTEKRKNRTTKITRK